uniref:Putative tick salivary antigen-5 protein n=1 Tax=Rhipicephalus pulchellus TaxID=72859 RepID=L7M950_RHIPC
MNLLAVLVVAVYGTTVATSNYRMQYIQGQPPGNLTEGLLKMIGGLGGGPGGGFGGGIVNGLGGVAPAVEEPVDFEGDFTPEMKKFQRQVLKATNRARRRHGVRILRLDKQLNRYAQAWALMLALKDAMQHRTNPAYGENLYMWWSTDLKAPITGSVPVKEWYKEIKQYDFANPGFRSDIGHFTQLVWKDSRRLGTGIARSRKGTIYIVCVYNPRGNILGQFGAQVPRPLSRGGAVKGEEVGEGDEEGSRKRRRRRRHKDEDEGEDDSD